jgi:hypothetical protein
MSRPPEPSRKISPITLSPIEKEMLTRLSLASGLSRCAVVRNLILRATAHQQLGPARSRPEMQERGRG